MSPVFRRESEYTFKIYSNEEERMHIHVIYGAIKKIVERNADRFKEQYREHIGKRIDD